jgi:hypothetical protein
MKTLATRKCYALRALHIATVALITTHALFAQQLSPQLQPKVEARALALTPLAAKLTDDSLLSSAVRLKPGLRKLDLGSLAQRRVKLGDQQEASLDEVTRKVFADNDAIAQSARALAGRGLLGKPVMVREVIEADDSYVLIQATTLDVQDPAEVGRGVPAFADFMSLRPAGQVKLADLSDAERAGLDEYVRNETPKLDPTHPLAQASKQGPEAVLKAIAEGKGEFEIIDTIVVPKSPLAMRGGELLHPDFIEGAPNFTNARLLPRSLFKPAGNSEPAASGPPVEEPSVRSDGSVNFKTEFLAGFTKGSSWHWERRWRYPSGFFRITLGASYGLGFRAPILVQGVIAPHRVEVRDNHDHPFDLLSKVSASTRNMNADFYRATGLPASKVFEGKELVCEFQFLYGYKLRAFWTDILHKKWTTIGFDHGDNFDPPFGDRALSRDVVIPASLTRTDFDFEVLKGKAEAGLRLTGHGSVNLDYEPLWGGKPVLKKTLRFPEGADKELGSTMPMLAAAQGETAKQEFGIRLSKPSYDLSLSVTPEIRIGVRAGYKSFSRSFSTGWILLNDLKINLGSVTLGRHEGTRSEYVWNKGVKTFTSINTGANPIAGEGSTILPRNGTTVGLRSVVNHRWVRAGLGEQSLLAASSEQRAWLGGIRVHPPERPPDRAAQHPERPLRACRCHEPQPAGRRKRTEGGIGDL